MRQRCVHAGFLAQRLCAVVSWETTRDEPRGEPKGVGSDVIVIGAGVAGLQCSRRLQESGASVMLLDRADKVGGRCATRAFDGQPADYGPVFLHGHDAAFLRAVESTPGVHLREGWPALAEGTGTPCQPEAFTSSERRLALAEGLNAFPQAMAQGLPVRLRTQVESVRVEGRSVTVTSTGGERFHSRHLVLAMALEQSVPFLRMLPPSSERDGVLALLGTFGSVACLTVIAGYPEGTRAPSWDVCYPEDSDALLLASHETSKRPGSPSVTMLYQALPRWSREYLEDPRESWSRALLDSAGGRLGAWAASPDWAHLHRWRYARLDRANELAAPVELRVGESRVGLAGDLFAAGGGLQAAWISGDRLAARLAS